MENRRHTFIWFSERKFQKATPTTWMPILAKSLVGIGFEADGVVCWFVGRVSSCAQTKASKTIGKQKSPGRSTRPGLNTGEIKLECCETLHETAGVVNVASSPLDPVRDDLPEPPVPANLCVATFPHFQFEPAWFLDSDIFVALEPHESCAAMNLVMRSWTQTPAGSIPVDNDALLARWCGMSLKDFQTIKPNVLKAGWQVCSDGRAYFGYMVAEALRVSGKRSFDAKRKHRQRNGAIIDDMSHGCPMGQTQDNHGTDAGLPQESSGSHALKTESKSKTETEVNKNPESKKESVRESDSRAARESEPETIFGFKVEPEWLRLMKIAHPLVQVDSFITRKAKHVMEKHPNNRKEQISYMEAMLANASKERESGTPSGPTLSTSSSKTNQTPKPREARMIDGVMQYWVDSRWQRSLPPLV